MSMDKKTVMGFIIVGLGFSFEVIAKAYGINGVIEETAKSLIATGLFLIAGIQLNQYRVK